jgi:hypothetical protein
MEPLTVVAMMLTFLSQLFRFLGMAILGIGMTWLALDLMKKIQVWQGQVAIFLGLTGLAIAMTVFTGWGALGAFSIGVGVAIFLWGMPKKQKKDEEES